MQVEADVSSHGQHGSITDHIALLRTHPTGEQRLDVSVLDPQTTFAIMC
jgi:hypothetical protein